MRLFRYILLVFIFLGAFVPLFADYSVYYSPKSRGLVIQETLDAMGKHGFRFSVRKVFNEKADGKLGFMFWLYPGKNYCEILFYERPKGKGTIVKIFTGNAYDTARFHRLMTRALKMTDGGRVREGRGGRWPRPR